MYRKRAQSYQNHFRILGFETVVNSNTRAKLQTPRFSVIIGPIPRKHFNALVLEYLMDMLREVAHAVLAHDRNGSLLDGKDIDFIRQCSVVSVVKSRSPHESRVQDSRPNGIN